MYPEEAWKQEATRVRNCGRLSKSIFIATATCEFHDAELCLQHVEVWPPSGRHAPDVNPQQKNQTSPQKSFAAQAGCEFKRSNSISGHTMTYHCWQRFDSKPACLQETLVQPERTWQNLGLWVISPRRSCCWETTGACRCKGWMFRMAVICGIFLGEKTGSISFKSKSLDRQISRSPASSFFGKSPGSFASIETAQDFEALIWNGFDEAKSLRMDEIVDLLSLKRIDLPRNYLGVKVHPMARFF